MPAVECRSLTKYYGDGRGIEDLSFPVSTLVALATLRFGRADLT